MEIYFYGKYDSGKLRGGQMVEVMQAKGIKCSYNSKSEPENTLVILIKSFPKVFVDKLLQNNNRIITDMVDETHELLQYQLSKSIHIIPPNNSISKELKLKYPNIPITTIFHHWDPRLRSSRTRNNDTFSLCFIGTPQYKMQQGLNLLYPELVTSVGSNPNKSDVCKYNIHYSVRSVEASKNKPSTKVSTAAALGCPIITTRDNSTIDVLGDDYPYFAKDLEKSSIVETIKYATETFNTTTWKKALIQMEHVKNITDINIIVEQYALLLSKYMRY